MRTAIRKPKIRKPSKGMKMFLKQGMNAIKQVVKSVIPKPKQWYHTHEYMRVFWLRSHSRSKYKPHQGPQEKARRVSQMARGMI